MGLVGLEGFSCLIGGATDEDADEICAGAVGLLTSKRSCVGFLGIGFNSIAIGLGFGGLRPTNQERVWLLTSRLWVRRWLARAEGVRQVLWHFWQTNNDIVFAYSQHQRQNEVKEQLTASHTSCPSRGEIKVKKYSS